MNLGRSYKIEEPTQDQRLTEVERKFDVILEKIQKYDEVLDKFKIIQSELYNLASKQKTQEEKFSLSSSALNEHLSGISSQLKQSDFQQRNLGSNFSELSRKVDSHKEESNKRHDEAIDCIKELRQEFLINLSKSASADYVEKLSSEIGKKFDKLAHDFADIKLSGAVWDQKISNHYAKLSEIENRLNTQNAEVIHKKFQNELELHKKTTKDDILSAMSISNNRMLELKDSLQTQLVAMKQEILGTPSVLESVRKEIMNKLEIASLDGNNAMMKTGNVAKKVDLLEKKIENVNLILQKNDIK